MPNHVINELIFRNVGEVAQDQILAAACGNGGEVDFGVLVPMPLNIWWYSVGQQHEKAFRRTGLEWSRENWGTKWNAYGHVPAERSGDTLILRFQTAWSPPYPWLAAVFNSTKLPFEHNWLDEGRSEGFHGEFIMKDDAFGPDWRETQADEALYRHLHLLLWGVEEFPAEDEDVPA